jgi:tellurite resistance protein TehA-like permease
MIVFLVFLAGVGFFCLVAFLPRIAARFRKWRPMTLAGRAGRTVALVLVALFLLLLGPLHILLETLRHVPPRDDSEGH